MAYASAADLQHDLPQTAIYGQQTVTVTGSPTGGAFTLDYDGVDTVAIAYNAPPSAIRVALEGVGTIGAGGIKQISGPRGGPWAIIFNTDIGTTRLELGTNLLTGGTSPSVSTSTRAEVILERMTQVIDTYVGYSWADAETVPADIVDANVQLAVRRLRAADAGFSDVIGVDGNGAVGYSGALPKEVKTVLDLYRLALVTPATTITSGRILLDYLSPRADRSSWGVG